MDFSQLLMQLFMGGQGKDMSRLWSGGPTLEMAPGGSGLPMPQNVPPQMSRGGPVPDTGGTVMPKSVPGMPMPNMLNETVVPKQMPPGLDAGFPPGLAPSGAEPPMGLPPSGPGSPGMMGFMPPTGQPMGIGAPGPAPAPTAAPPPPGAPAGGFGQQARSLLGGPGRGLYDILADAMAGVAAVDPTAPGIKAFGQGFTGSRVSKKARESDATAAEDKAYEREGTDLDREVKRGEWGNTQKMAPLQRAKAAAEVKDTLDYSKRDKQIDAAALDAISRDQYLSPEEKIAKIKEYLGEGQKQTDAGGGAKPANGTTGRWKGKIITYDAQKDAWFDEQGNMVDLPSQ